MSGSVVDLQEVATVFNKLTYILIAGLEDLDVRVKTVVASAIPEGIRVLFGDTDAVSLLYPNPPAFASALHKFRQRHRIKPFRKLAPVRTLLAALDRRHPEFFQPPDNRAVLGRMRDRLFSTPIISHDGFDDVYTQPINSGNELTALRELEPRLSDPDLLMFCYTATGDAPFSTLLPFPPFLHAAHFFLCCSDLICGPLATIGNLLVVLLLANAVGRPSFTKFLTRCLLDRLPVARLWYNLTAVTWFSPNFVFACPKVPVPSESIINLWATRIVAAVSHKYACVSSEEADQILYYVFTDDVMRDTSNWPVLSSTQYRHLADILVRLIYCRPYSKPPYPALKAVIVALVLANACQERPVAKEHCVTAICERIVKTWFPLIPATLQAVKDKEIKARVLSFLHSYRQFVKTQLEDSDVEEEWCVSMETSE